MLWLQGRYVYEAIQNLSPILHAFAKKGTKAEPYRNEPYDLFGDKKEISAEEKEKKEKNEALVAEVYMRQMMRAGRNWGKNI